MHKDEETGQDAIKNVLTLNSRVGLKRTVFQKTSSHLTTKSKVHISNSHFITIHGAQATDIQLQDLVGSHNNEHNLNEIEHARGVSNSPAHHEFSLPAADRGTAAWLFLAAGFVVEALVWGFSFSFGVFQQYYSTHEPFSSNPSGIAVVGTTATGIMYMSGLIMFPVYKKWPWLANRSKWAGLPLMAAGLIGASFARNENDLLMTQGIVYGIGGSIVYNPLILFIDEWFVQRKGLAFGILWAGTGGGGLLTPFLMNTLLEKYGFRTALRIWSVALIIISTPLIYFIRPRLPISPVSQNPRYGLNFLKDPGFWILQVGLACESLGYFIPSIYLPSFATSLGLSPSIGTMLVAIVNASAVFASVVMGMLCDRFHVTTVILFSTVGATVAVLLFWGISTALPLLCIFSILYGFFAGGFVSSNAGIIKLIKGRDQTVDVGIMLGVMSAARGLGSIVSGPLSEALMRGSALKGEAGFGYGSGYGSLIVFTGVTTAFGGVSFLGKRLGWIR